MDRIKLSYKLRASTLVEVLVAVVIISIVFSIAINVYLNVQRSGFSFKRISADVCLQESMAQVIEKKKYESFNRLCGEFSIQCDASEVSGQQGLKALFWEVRDSTGSILAKRRLLVYAQE